MTHLASAELAVQILALDIGGLAHDERDVEPLAQLTKLLQILADD